jgi:hypothetical protein
MASAVGVCFLDHFAALRDPRQGRKVVCPLPEVLLCGSLAGAEDFVEICRWARLHIDFPLRANDDETATPRKFTLEGT